jgi:hypothetical protein
MDNTAQAHEVLSNLKLDALFAEIQRNMGPTAQLVSDASAYALASEPSVAHLESL